MRGKLGVVGTGKTCNWLFTTLGEYAVELMVVDSSSGSSKKGVEFTIAN